jgi:hypothetical protein
VKQIRVTTPMYEAAMMCLSSEQFMATMDVPEERGTRGTVK